MAYPSGAEQPSTEKKSCQIDEMSQFNSPRKVTLSEQGGYNCEFVERPQELQTDCPICQVVLREPFQVSCCGCSFCRTCIERIPTDKKACPECKDADFSLFLNKGLQRSLHSFRVRCTHQKSGCKWTGKLGELDAHLNRSPIIGKQLNGCEFTELACTHCDKYIQRRKLHAHANETCPQRPFRCDYCKVYISTHQDVISNHFPSCICYPVPCPNKCGMYPERQNVETHVNTVCSLTVVNCDFHYAGCEVRLERKVMPIHLAESLTTHISFLTNKTKMLAGGDRQGTLAEHVFPLLSLLVLHNQQLTTHLEESQRKIQQLEKDKQALLWHTGVLFPPVKLTMTNFEKMKRTKKEWYSPPFYTHTKGYKMCLKVYANGNGVGKGTHISVFAYLMRGEFDDCLEWPFKGSVVIQLCNQLKDNYHFGHTIDFNENADASNRVTSGERAECGWGTDTLIAHTDFNKVDRQYLMDNCIYFRIVTVESLSEPGVLPTERTMTNFEEHKGDGNHWLSQPFYTHPQGYKMCLDVFANGSGDGKGTHVSVGACLMRGDFDDGLKWPFQGDVTIVMLNQLEDINHTTHTIRFSDTMDNKVIGRVTGREKAQKVKGNSTFIPHSDLNYNPTKNCQYLKYNCLRFQVGQVELK